MIVSAQDLATYLEQDYSAWSALQQSRAEQHILTAGDEIRGALAVLYSIPAYTRDSSGTLTAPLGSDGVTPVSDPVRTALGPIVKMLAAAFLLNPSRGIQPQEDQSASSNYRAEARKQLEALRTGKAFIAPISTLTDYGITATDALNGMITTTRVRPTPGLRQPREGLMGDLHNPDGSAWDTTAVSDADSGV